jgi:hypothetical protein
MGPATESNIARHFAACHAVSRRGNSQDKKIRPVQAIPCESYDGFLVCQSFLGCLSIDLEKSAFHEGSNLSHAIPGSGSLQGIKRALADNTSPPFIRGSGSTD